MSYEAMSAVSKIKVGSAMRKAVLLQLANVAREDGGNIYASNQYIADTLECDRKTIVRAVKELLDLGVLKLVEERHGGTNVYQIHPDVIEGVYHRVTCTTESHVPQSPRGCTTESQGVYHRVPGGVPQSPTNNKITTREQQDNNKKRVKVLEHEQGVASFEMPFDSKEFTEAWEAFKKMRLAKKLPLNVHSCKLIKGKMNDFSEKEIIEALNESCISQWKSIFPKRARSSYQQSNGVIDSMRLAQDIIEERESREARICQ